MTNEELEQVVDEVSEVVETADTPDVSEEKSKETLEIERLQAENDVLADKVLRAQAELQNVQKRQQKERGDLIRYRSQSLTSALLPALDSLEQALKVEVTGEQGEQLKKGFASFKWRPVAIEKCTSFCFAYIIAFKFSCETDMFSPINVPSISETINLIMKPPKRIWYNITDCNIKGKILHGFKREYEKTEKRFSVGVATGGSVVRCDNDYVCNFTSAFD